MDEAFSSTLNSIRIKLKNQWVNICHKHISNDNLILEFITETKRQRNVVPLYYALWSLAISSTSSSTARIGESSSMANSLIRPKHFQDLFFLSNKRITER